MLVALLILTLPKQLFAKAEEARKTYSESFEVNPDATLKLDNEFGMISLISWDKNVVEIEVEVFVDAKNEDKASKKLKQIDVLISGSSNMVKVITEISKSSGSFNGEFSIDMTIRAPKSMVLELNNEFGDVVITEWDGPADIKIEFGSLTANKFTSEDLIIDLEFSKGNIELINKAEIDLEFSDSFSIQKAKELDIDSEFSAVDVDFVERITASFEYGAFELGQANQVNFNGEFTDFTLGKLYKKGDFKNEYGNIKIEFVSKSFEELILNNSFSNIKVYFEEGSEFSFELSSEFGDINVMDDSTVKIDKEGIGEHYIKGYYGSSSSTSRVIADSEYGKISLMIVD